jgi:hypothetical protein
MARVLPRYGPALAFSLLLNACRAVPSEPAVALPPPAPLPPSPPPARSAEPPAPSAPEPPCADAAACRASCQGGRLASCVRLSRFLKAGEGVARNVEEARELAERACVAGLPEGCAIAGESLADDDPRLAAGYFERSCSGGHADGCALLALATLDGRGVAKDPARAIDLLDRSCKAGSAPGCHHLAAAHARGAIAPRDEAKALSLHEHACDLGSAPSCREAGSMRDLGQGAASDEALARALYDRACKGGDVPGCELANALEDRVRPIQRAVVRVLVIGHAGARDGPRDRDQRTAKKRAQAAAAKLDAGADVEKVAAEYDDAGRAGRGGEGERTVTRRKASTPLQDAIFKLRPRRASVLESPVHGYQVIYRVR